MLPFLMLGHYFQFPVFNGARAVILFFVLSGFLITYLLFEEKEKTGIIAIKEFYLRRILRIWPLYFLVLLLASIVYFYLSNDASEYTDRIFYYLLFLPNLAYILHLTIDHAVVL